MNLLWGGEMRSETRFAIGDEDALQVSWNWKSKTFMDFYISLKSSWSNKIDTPQSPFDNANQLWVNCRYLVRKPNITQITIY